MHSVTGTLSEHHRDAFKNKRIKENKCPVYMKRHIPHSFLSFSFKCRRNKKVKRDLVDTITRKSLFVLLWKCYCSSLNALFILRMK